VSHKSIARDFRAARLSAIGLGYRPQTVTSGPLQFVILLVASWIGRRQGEAIEYLRAENRVLRARLGPKRLRFSDGERRLLAEKGKTRRVHIAGVTCRADGEWMAQVARNLTDAAAGPLTGFGHLIVDRDPLYTAQGSSACCSRSRPSCSQSS
jgi:hypothetical protein